MQASVNDEAATHPGAHDDAEDGGRRLPRSVESLSKRETVCVVLDTHCSGELRPQVVTQCLTDKALGIGIFYPTRCVNRSRRSEPYGAGRSCGVLKLIDQCGYAFKNRGVAACLRRFEPLSNSNRVIVPEERALDFGTA